MLLETNRLILRPFKIEDSNDVYEYLHNPLVNCFACMRLNSLEEAQILLENRIKENNLCFAIVLKETNKVIGEVEAHPESMCPEDNCVIDTFSPCWMLNKDYQHKGYAFEGVKLFFDYLFNEKGARRIYAYTEDYNVASQNLCKKLGMRLEGLFKEFVSFVKDEDGNPIYENTMQWAILKKEWLELCE